MRNIFKSLPDIIIENNRESFSNHFEKFEKNFLLICDNNYTFYLESIIRSICLNGKKWGIILIILNFKNNVNKIHEIYSENLLIIEHNCHNIKFDYPSQQKPFIANIRAPFLRSISRNFLYRYLIYTDVDSILIKDPTKYLEKELDISPQIAFRQIHSKAFNKHTGCLIFKSGVIIISNPLSKNKDNILTFNKFLNILNSYSDFVSEQWDTWFADQWGLVNLSISKEKLEYITILDNSINDWSFNYNSYIWSAKGPIKEFYVWKFICYMMKNYKQSCSHINFRILINLIYIIEDFIRKLNQRIKFKN